MSLVVVISIFAVIWVSVYLLDITLRTRSYTKQGYTQFISSIGLSFDLLQVRIFTQRLNGCFHDICRVRCIPWNLWFSCGVIFSIVFMVISICLLFLLAYNTLLGKPLETQVLTPLMPGVNLPVNHLSFYVLTLIVCAFLHEAGHALAAICERVRLHGFGLFVFGLYPGAYVDLNSADLQSLSPLSQLRIYCAGVWHNAVIALLSVIVFYSLPILLSPVYHVGSGVGVAYLREDSVVTGHRGLLIGDAITHINSCPVNDQSDWYKCLEEAYTQPSGYCVSGAYLNIIDNKLHVPRRRLSGLAPATKPEFNSPDVYVKYASGINCCTNQSSATHLCFTYIISNKHHVGIQRYACLPARAVTERTSCKLTSDCDTINPSRTLGQSEPFDSTAVSGVSTRSMYCVIPSPPDNFTQLVRLSHNRRKAPAILFLGPLDDLLSSVGVSDYVPRWPSFMPPNIPHFLGLICTYLFSFSGALVILNAVPCYALDGQWILKAFMDLCFTNSTTTTLFSQAKRKVIFIVIMCSGSGLLALNLLLAFYYLFLQAASSSYDNNNSNNNNNNNLFVNHVVHNPLRVVHP